MSDNAEPLPEDPKLHKLADNLRGLHDAAQVDQPNESALTAPCIFVGAEGCRPVIQAIIVKLVELLRHRGLYRRGNEIGTINQLTGEWDPMNPHKFCSWVRLTAGIIPVKRYEKDGSPTEGEIGVDQARLILASDELRVKLPLIENINRIRMPVMRDVLDERGSVKRKGFAKIELLPHGYDAPTKTFTICGGLDFDEDLDPNDGCKWMIHLLEYFSWADKDRRAVQIAAMLSVFGRFLHLGKAPFFLWNSNLPGSGKSMLTQLCLHPVFGEVGGEGYDQQDKQELKKTLDKSAQAYAPYLWFDDMDKIKLRSPHLNRWSTIGVWEGRVMGTNQGFKVPLRCVTFFTGNMITMDDNLMRRTLQIDLFAKQAASERRLPADAVMLDDDFFADEQKLGKVLACLWGFVRWWDENDRPRTTARPLASFTSWSEVIPSIVACAGFGNALAPFESPDTGDQDARDFKTLAKMLIRDHCTEEREGQTVMLESTIVTMRDIIRCARLNGLFTEKLWTLDQVMDELLTREKKKNWTWQPIVITDQEDAAFDRDPTDEEKRYQAAQWSERAMDSSWAKFFRKAAVAGQWFPAENGVLYEFGDRASARVSRFALKKISS